MPRRTSCVECETRFPDVDMTLVVDPTRHGVNPKIGNLINMMPAARHDVLVIADSDVHVRPDYLERLMAALEQPGVGLVTTLYVGLPLLPITLPGRLGAMQITNGFLPGALLSRAIGRQDCLGATMCLRRKDLERIGGFHALVDHLADDNVLGRRIAGLGLRVVLAQTVPLTTVPETGFSRAVPARVALGADDTGVGTSWLCRLDRAVSVGLVSADDRFGRRRAVVDRLCSWSSGCCGPSPPSSWTVRWRHCGRDERTIGRERRDDEAALAFSCPVWLLPLRDIMSVAVMLASYGGRHVDLARLRLQRNAAALNNPPPIEGIKAR